MSTASKSKKTKKTSSKPNKAIEFLEAGGVWEWMLGTFNGKENVKILNIAETNKDSDFLLQKDYNVTTIEPNNIRTIPAEETYQIVLITYLNKIMNNEWERNDLLFEASERRWAEGFTIVSTTNKNVIDEGWDRIEENSKFSIYLI